MDSLQWVDQTYVQKHKADDPAQLRAMYYPNLRQYSTHSGSTQIRTPVEAVTAFLVRYTKKAGISLAILALSYIPYVGRFVLPAASFYTFNRAVGPGPAAVIFGTGIFLPKRYIVIFLQSYFSSRSLMRELVSTEIQSYDIRTDQHSSSLTFPASVSQRSKRGIGSMTARDCFSVLAWDSTSSFEFRYLVF